MQTLQPGHAKSPPAWTLKLCCTPKSAQALKFIPISSTAKHPESQEFNNPIHLYFGSTSCWERKILTFPSTAKCWKKGRSVKWTARCPAAASQRRPLQPWHLLLPELCNKPHSWTEKLFNEDFSWEHEQNQTRWTRKTQPCDSTTERRRFPSFGQLQHLGMVTQTCWISPKSSLSLGAQAGCALDGWDWECHW